MNLIDEDGLFKFLDSSTNVLLIEPNYPRSYPPIGLGKIGTYLKSKNIKYTFSRFALKGNFDLICVTSLFTTDHKKVTDILFQYKNSFFMKNCPIVLGGIYASLMPEHVFKIIGKMSNLFIFKNCSDRLDSIVPDYSINYGLKGFWKRCSIFFTVRGCKNKCSYCMVPKLEPKFHILLNWKQQIVNEKDVCIIMDNNLLVCSMKHLSDVCGVLVKKSKKVLFDNAIDVRLVNNENVKYLSKLNYVAEGHNGLRFAFDGMWQDGDYQKALKLFEDSGCKVKGRSMTYVLFNYKDTPQDAYYRIKESWRLGSNPYFMRYRPLDALTKNEYVGKYWTSGLVRAFKLYGELYGWNTGDKKFETWIKNKKVKIKLTDNDWDHWYYKK